MARPENLRGSLPGLRRILKRVWPTLRENRLLLTGSMAALLGSTLVRLLEPWPLAIVIDRVIGVSPESHALGLGPLDELSPTTLLTVAAIAVVAIATLRGALSYFNRIGFALIGNRALMQVRNDLFRHVQSLGLGFHTESRKGDLVVRMTDDVTRLKDAAVTAFLPLLANVFVLVGMLAVMFVMNWRLALIATTIVPMFALSNVRIGRKIHQTARVMRERQGALAASASESIQAASTVQALSLEETFETSFVSQNLKGLRESVKATRLSAQLERTVAVFVAIGTALVLWFGARMVLARELSPGELLVFLTYLRRVFKPAQDLAKYNTRLAKAAAAGERVLDVLEERPEIRDRPDAVEAPPFEGSVRFENVTFGYKPGRAVLKNLNLEIQPGESVAVVGESGVGKSTLLSLLLRLYDPWEGRVCVDDRDVRDYTFRSLRGQMAVVPQDTVLFRASVRDNIAFGATDSERSAIEAAARLANAHEFISRLPEGYDSVLAERGLTLSRGERQRIAIARAAVRDARILIFDEPVSGLDDENERAVVEALARLAQGRTTFVVTHDLGHAAACDRVVYLAGKRKVESGTHSELLGRDGLYAAAWNARPRSGPGLVRAI